MTYNPDLEQVFKADGTTDQVFIETPPIEAQYSMEQKKEVSDENEDGDGGEQEVQDGTNIVQTLLKQQHQGVAS